MVSRQLILSLLLAAGASAASSTTRGLRASNQAAVAPAAPAAPAKEVEGESDDDYLIIIPDVEEGRRLQDDNVTDTNSTDIDTNTTKEEKAVETIRISRKCLAILQATVNENDRMKKENYFYFTDAMSNGYFSFNNATDFSDLPMGNKFSWVTLTCQCTQFGGRDNCCQGERASIYLPGIDDPTTMDTPMQRYVKDVCETTKSAIGEDNMLPPTGEFPTTKMPTTSPAPTASNVPSASPTSSSAPTSVPSTTTWPTLSMAPSAAPTVSMKPTVNNDTEVIPPVEETPGNGGDGDNKTGGGGLSDAAIAGIAIAGAAVLSMIVYLASRESRQRDEVDPNADDDVDAMSAQGNQKELLAITNGDLIEDAPGRQNSPDATNSMTASDVSSIPSMSTKGKSNVGANSSYYASNSLLPGHPDEESMLSSSDGPSFFTDESMIVEEGVEVESPRGLAARDSLNNSNLNTSDNSGESLDQAIESGNWEAVAASAAAIVKNNEPMQSTTTVKETVRKFEDQEV